MRLTTALHICCHKHLRFDVSGCALWADPRGQAHGAQGASGCLALFHCYPVIINTPLVILQHYVTRVPQILSPTASFHVLVWLEARLVGWRQATLSVVMAGKQVVC